jgi:hypothetical protein
MNNMSVCFYGNYGVVALWTRYNKRYEALYREIHFIFSLFDSILLSFWWMDFSALMCVTKLHFSECSQKLLPSHKLIQFAHNRLRMKNERFRHIYKRCPHDFKWIPGSNSKYWYLLRYSHLSYDSLNDSH